VRTSLPTPPASSAAQGDACSLAGRRRAVTMAQGFPRGDPPSACALRRCCASGRVARPLSPQNSRCERLWVKDFHSAHVAWACDPALFLNIFVLAWMASPWNASDVRRTLAGRGEPCSLAFNLCGSRLSVPPSCHGESHGVVAIGVRIARDVCYCSLAFVLLSTVPGCGPGGGHGPSGPSCGGTRAA
jgi:hypothetical protein